MPQRGHSGVDFPRSPSPRGPVSPWPHLPATPSDAHRAPQTDGRKEGALEGKGCVLPRVQCYFSKWFWFLSHVVCDAPKQKAQRKRNETGCTELFKIKQAPRGSGSLSQVSHSTHSHILVIGVCYGFHYGGACTKADDQRESTGPTAASCLPLKPPDGTERSHLFPAAPRGPGGPRAPACGERRGAAEGELTPKGPGPPRATAPGGPADTALTLLSVKPPGQDSPRRRKLQERNVESSDGRAALDHFGRGTGLFPLGLSHSQGTTANTTAARCA